MSEEQPPATPEEELGVEAEDPAPLSDDRDDPVGGLDEVPERLEDLEARVTELEMEERRDQDFQVDEDLFDKVFPATLATDNTFTELVSLGGTLTTFTDGRTGSAIALAAGQSVLVEVVDPGTGTQSASMKFIAISGGGGATANYEVLVKQNGSNANGPLYDLYALTDTGLVTKLNLAGALEPNLSPARLATGLTPIAAANGHKAVAYTNTDGTIALESIMETVCTNSQTWGTNSL